MKTGDSVASACWFERLQATRHWWFGGGETSPSYARVQSRCLAAFTLFLFGQVVLRAATCLSAHRSSRSPSPRQQTGRRSKPLGPRSSAAAHLPHSLHLRVAPPTAAQHENPIKPGAVLGRLLPRPRAASNALRSAIPDAVDWNAAWKFHRPRLHEGISAANRCQEERHVRSGDLWSRRSPRTGTGV